MSLDGKKLSGGRKRQWLRERYDEIREYVAMHGIYAASGYYDTHVATLRNLLLTENGEYGHQDSPNYDMRSLRHQMEQVHSDVEKFAMWAASVNEERRGERKDIRELINIGRELLASSEGQAAAFGEALGRAIGELTLGATPLVVDAQSRLEAKARDISLVMSGQKDSDLTDNNNKQAKTLCNWDDLSKLIAALLPALKNQYPAGNLGGTQPGTNKIDHSNEVPL